MEEKYVDAIKYYIDQINDPEKLRLIYEFVKIKANE